MTTAAHSPLFRHCSAAHKSDSERCSTSSRSSRTPARLKACGPGTSTGPASTTGRLFPVQRASSGSSSPSSPQPLTRGSSSVRRPRGQPPPGRPRSSQARPLGSAGRAVRALPRHSSGRRSSSSSSKISADIANSVWGRPEHCMDLQYRTSHQPASPFCPSPPPRHTPNCTR